MAQGEDQFSVRGMLLYVATPALFASTLGYNRLLATRTKRREVPKLTLLRESRITRSKLIDRASRKRRRAATICSVFSTHV